MDAIDGIPFPEWASPRLTGWHYGGWVARIDTYGHTFAAVIERIARSVFGEVRQIDAYPEGAIIWYRK